MGITENEVLEALRAALQMPELDGAGYTTSELAELLESNQQAVTRYLRPLVKRGAVVCRRKKCLDICGRWVSLPCYRVAA